MNRTILLTGINSKSVYKLNYSQRHFNISYMYYDLLNKHYILHLFTKSGNQYTIPSFRKLKESPLYTIVKQTS